MCERVFQMALINNICSINQRRYVDSAVLTGVFTWHRKTDLLCSFTENSRNDFLKRSSFSEVEHVWGRMSSAASAVWSGAGVMGHGGEQFVQWPPVSHWLRRLQILASDPVEPAAISGTDAVHPAVNCKVNSALAAHWASSESRVCSFPAHTQHQCWSSSPVCHSSEHPSTCSSPLEVNQLFFVLLTFRRLFPCTPTPASS